MKKNLKMTNAFVLGLVFIATACNGQKNEINTDLDDKRETLMEMKDNYEEATLGAGCFWCIEAMYDALQGVVAVESGYSGGQSTNPSYKEVCGGETGHAEVIRIVFDPEIISFADILEIFWTAHDPTTLNRQGNDVGTQYRSAIFYHSEEQKAVAEESLRVATESGLYDDPIVTEISELINYYAAEDYHQEYFENNPNQPYCSFVVRPKVEKFRKMYKERLKDQSF